MNKKNKKIILLSVTICLAATLISFAANRSSKKVENSFTPTSANIGILENGIIRSDTASVKLEESGDKYTATKEIEIQNMGGANGVPLFVRVCIFPKFDITSTNKSNVQVGILSDSFPAEISGNSFTMGDVTFILDFDWKSNWHYENGYFYYIQKNADGNSGVLDVGDNTGLLLKSVSVNAEKYDEDYIQKDAKLKVVVLADSIQTVGNTAAGVDGGAVARWNVNVLESTDEARINSETLDLETIINTFSASRAAETGESNLTISQMERIQNMISSVTVSTVYDTEAYYENEDDEESEVKEEEDVADEDEEEFSEEEDSEDVDLTENEG